MIKRNNANSQLWVGNHIFLEDRKVKAYEIPESDEGLMAAESRLPYEKIENAKHV